MGFQYCDERVQRRRQGTDFTQRESQQSASTRPGRTKRGRPATTNRPTTNRQLRMSAGDEEFQGAGDDFELDREAGEGLAADLGVEGAFAEGLASDGVGIVEMEGVRPPQVSPPAPWQ